MKDSKNQTPSPNEQEQKRNRSEEQPDRTDMKVPEGPEGARDREDVLEQTTRRGER